MAQIDAISKPEAVKQQSRQLRGHIARDLADTITPFDKEGYALLNAKDVVDRLARAGSAELAAIQLYESSHKRRETVLSAVTRELRRQTAGAPDQYE